MSSPVERYVPFHKRSPSSSSTSSTATPVLTYTPDELFALAPSTLNLHHSESSTQHHTPEHTYMHLQPHQGWAELNNVMRGYLRLSCPEIVMNRKMRKSVEYQHFQARTSSHTKSPTSQRTRSRSPSSRSSASGSPRTKPMEVDPVPVPIVVRPTTIKSVPASIKKRPQSRRTRPTASTARTRMNGFNIFHKQLAGAAVDSQWRKVVIPLPAASVH